MDAGDFCRVISGRPGPEAANPGVGSPRRSPSERKEARHANAGQDDVRVLRAEMRQTQRPARKSLGFKNRSKRSDLFCCADRQNPPVGFRTLDSPAGVPKRTSDRL